MQNEAGYSDQPQPVSSTPSTDVRGTIGYFALYGAPNSTMDGRDVRERATSESWGGTSDFHTPVTVPWVLEIRKDDLKNLIMGYVPEGMEDKWFVFSEDANDSSDLERDTDGLRVVFSSSFTGIRYFDLNVEFSAALDENGLPDAWVKSITYETGPGEDGEEVEDDPEAWAKEAAREICSWVLDVELGEERTKDPL